MDAPEAPADISRAPSSPLFGFFFPRSANPRWWGDALLLGSRLYAGVSIAGAGLDKLPTPDWMADQVTQVGFPAPEFFAFCACYAEVVFGALLALGLFTRVSAVMLAWTLGVAAFGFHKVSPITGMHITQGFVWLFIVFVAIGPGRISVDQIIRCVFIKDGKAKLIPALITGAVLAAPLFGYGLYKELAPPPPQVPSDAATEAPEIESVSLVGRFNGWDLEANPMQLAEESGTVWRTTADFPVSGPTPVKVAANGSWDLALGAPDGGVVMLPAEFTGNPQGGNIIVAIDEAGPHTIEVDASDFTVRIIKAE